MITGGDDCTVQRYWLGLDLYTCPNSNGKVKAKRQVYHYFLPVS